jgi:low temperature requirement protein LtrA
VLVLALVWWAWSAFVWAVNAQAQDARVIRVVLIDYAGPAWLTRERLRGIQRVAVAHGLIATIGMWWTYIHLVIVAGIIIFAAGIRLLAGNVLFGMRLLGELRWPQAAAAAALVLLYALSDGISAWPLTAATAGLMIALCAVEARVGRA